MADNAKRQYQKMVFEARNAWSQYFEDFSNDGKTGVDEFYHSLIGADKQHADIWSVMKICFILSLSGKFIIGRVVNIGGPQNFIITKSLIASVRTSRRRYQENLN